MQNLLRLLELILSERYFNVNLNGKVSRRKILPNGLLQGFVLSRRLHLMYNVYTSDIVDRKLRKCIYADEIGLLAQETSFEQIENNLK